MKYLLVMLVVGVGLWLLLRPRGAQRPPAAPPRQVEPPADMVACAHCDLRLPRGEAVFDPEGRAFCDDAHRHAGPR
jgi:uncharacterized protein